MRRKLLRRNNLIFALNAEAIFFRLLLKFRETERSHSGRVRSLGKRVGGQLSRGFESLPLRQPTLVGANFGWQVKL